jgi:hypothetical protein
MDFARLGAEADPLHPVTDVLARPRPTRSLTYWPGPGPRARSLWEPARKAVHLGSIGLVSARDGNVINSRLIISLIFRNNFIHYF